MDSIQFNVDFIPYEEDIKKLGWLTEEDFKKEEDTSKTTGGDASDEYHANQTWQTVNQTIQPLNMTQQAGVFLPGLLPDHDESPKFPSTIQHIMKMDQALYLYFLKLKERIPKQTTISDDEVDNLVTIMSRLLDFKKDLESAKKGLNILSSKEDFTPWQYWLNTEEQNQQRCLKLIDKIIAKISKVIDIQNNQTSQKSNSITQGDSPINYLPSEILLNIAKFLNIRCLFKISSSICKFWNLTFNNVNSVVLWKSHRQTLRLSPDVQTTGQIKQKIVELKESTKENEPLLLIMRDPLKKSLLNEEDKTFINFKMKEALNSHISLRRIGLSTYQKMEECANCLPGHQALYMVLLEHFKEDEKCFENEKWEEISKHLLEIRNTTFYGQLIIESLKYFLETNNFDRAWKSLDNLTKSWSSQGRAAFLNAEVKSSIFSLFHAALKKEQFEFIEKAVKYLATPYQSLFMIDFCEFLNTNKDQNNAIRVFKKYHNQWKAEYEETESRRLLSKLNQCAIKLNISDRV